MCIRDSRRASRHHVERWYDGGLVPVHSRFLEDGEHENHEHRQGGEPRVLRRDVQAAGDRGVGVRKNARREDRKPIDNHIVMDDRHTVKRKKL